MDLIGCALVLLVFAVVAVKVLLPAIEGSDGADVAMISATSVIAFFAVAQFILQWRNHAFQEEIQRENQEFEQNIQSENQEFDRSAQRATYKLALFEQRAEIYSRVNKLVYLWIVKSEPEPEDIEELRSYLEKYQFLLEEVPRNYALEMVAKATDYLRNYQLWQRHQATLDSGSTLNALQTKVHGDALDRYSEITDWFGRQYTDGIPYEKFEDILTLPDDI